MYLKSKNIVITGGAGGMGSLLAKELTKEGANIIIVDRVEKIDFKAKLITGDLSTLEGIKAINEKLLNENVDILVNLAGLQYFGPAEEQSPEHTMLSYMVNLVAPVMLSQSLIKQMKERKSGHIVNIGSIFASINFAYFATYSSSKAGLKGFSEAIRRELKDDNIDITYIAPRAVKTPFNSGKVMELAELTKMNMDTPEHVVSLMVKAIKNKSKDIYIGFPEKLFVRVNAVCPRIVDGATVKDNKAAKSLFN
jgi:short-subunit dehydrogenase